MPDREGREVVSDPPGEASAVRTSRDIVLQGYHWPQEYLERTPDDGVFFLCLNMTSHCNYRCPYCFVGHENLRKGPDELSRDQKLRVVDQAREMGAHVVVMPGRGEPMADPDFWIVVEYATSLGMHVVVDSNIYLLDEAKIERLQSLPVSIFAKVDTLHPERYEQSVGARNVYPRFLRNLNLLVERLHRPVEDERGRLISRLGVNAVITRTSANDVEDVGRWCAERDIYFTCRSPVRIGEAVPNWDAIVGNDAIELRAIGARYASRDFTSATEGGHCGLYRFGITVENNGDIFVCPQARVSLGNVKVSSLLSLVQRRNGRGLLNKEVGYCFAKDQYNAEGAFTDDSQERRIEFDNVPA
jgi:MoaA/NifB/PqqE/SkfB family radical SAM enzyme